MTPKTEGKEKDEKKSEDAQILNCAR